MERLQECKKVLLKNEKCSKEYLSLPYPDRIRDLHPEFSTL